MQRLFLSLTPLLLIGVLISCRQDPVASQAVSSQVQASSTSWQSPADAYGQLLADVQMARVFPDGKTFTDCRPKYPIAEIIEKYEQQKTLPDFDLASFVEVNFNPPLSYSSGFVADKGRSLTEHINALWPVLTRPADTVQPGTKIALPNPYIVPGGRFGEIYYWDSYFTMLGLKAAGQEDMIQNMINNFAYLIDTIGHIPNGNRTYFLKRSQPPFFAMMVELLADGDETVLSQYADALEKEHTFWMTGQAAQTPGPKGPRVMTMPGGETLNRYWGGSEQPRSESYREDVELADTAGRDHAQLYQDLRAACESGWDFSSRWFSDPNDLGTIRTTEIIPVDLNCLLYQLEVTVSKAKAAAGYGEAAEKFAALAESRKKAILTYCWDPSIGYFQDYHLPTKTFTGTVSLAGMFPLFTGIATEKQATAAANYLKENFTFPGGLPATLNRNGQQWDAPNGWAPLQWVAIKGLRNYGHTEQADDLKARWVALNQQVYQSAGKLVEKYNVMDQGLEAGGGEYPLQDGFGWTNGVLLKLLTKEK